HRAQYSAAVVGAGEGRPRGRGAAAGEGLMVDSPLPALRAEYEQIARRLDGLTHGAEREAVKREIIAYFKRVDALIGELSALKEPANSLARINVGYICLKKRIFGEAIEHLSKAIRLDNDKKATLYAHFYLGLVYLQREMYEDAQTFFQKTLKLGPNLIEAYYE